MLCPRKPIKLWPYAQVTRLHQGGLDKLSQQTYKLAKDQQAREQGKKLEIMLHGSKEVLEVSVQLVFYMLLHQARAHGNPEPFSEFRQASATHT